MQVKRQQLHQPTEMNTVNLAFYLVNYIKMNCLISEVPI